MTQTFLGFCLSQLCMFLHTANRLWRLGACREGQLHSDTWSRRRSRHQEGGGGGGGGWDRREGGQEEINQRGGQTLATVSEDESSDGDSATSRRPFCSGWVNTASCQMVAVSPAGVYWSVIKNLVVNLFFWRWFTQDMDTNDPWCFQCLNFKDPPSSR